MINTAMFESLMRLKKYEDAGQVVENLCQINPEIGDVAYEILVRATRKEVDFFLENFEAWAEEGYFKSLLGSDEGHYV